VEPADSAAPRKPGPGLLRVVFEILGRLFSILVLGGAIFVGRRSPLLFLWGLWIEEVFSLVGLSVRKAIVRRAGAAASPLGLYFAFPAVHLVFVLFFALIGMTGMFSRAGAVPLAAPSLPVIVRIAAAFLFWAAVDVVRAVLRRRRGGSVDEELVAIDRGARLALFLPHITIIAGGFCLIMFRLGNWLAWGILAGKILFELLAFALAREKPRLS
jgi:hypothetical protein